MGLPKGAGPPGQPTGRAQGSPLERSPLSLSRVHPLEAGPGSHLVARDRRPGRTCLHTHGCTGALGPRAGSGLHEADPHQPSEEQKPQPATQHQPVGHTRGGGCVSVLTGDTPRTGDPRSAPARQTRAQHGRQGGDAGHATQGTRPRHETHTGSVSRGRRSRVRLCPPAGLRVPLPGHGPCLPLASAAGARAPPTHPRETEARGNQGFRGGPGRGWGHVTKVSVGDRCQ